MQLTSHALSLVFLGKNDLPGDCFLFRPPPFQHDLAARIGCRREQVSRELGAMMEEGLAEKIRGGLVLLRPSVLDKRVREAMNETG